MTQIFAYHGHFSGYAGNFLVRQGDAVGATHVGNFGTTDTRPDSLVSVRLAKDRSFSARAAMLGRRFGVTAGRGPVQTRRLRSVLADADVVYTMFLGTALDLVPLSRRGLNYVVHAGGSDVTTLQRVSAGYRRMSITAARKASVVTVGSQFLQRLYHSVDPKTPTQLHYIGVEVPKQLGGVPPDGPFRIVAVSRLHPVKGVDRSIKAFAQAFASNEDVVLDIVGDGPERTNLERLVRESGLQGRVRFHGSCTAAEVADYLGRAQLFVQHNVTMPNGAAEALGGSLLEASAHGIPVVGTRSGGVSESVIDGKTGLLSAEDDVRQMADNLRLLYSDRQLRETLGRAGRHYVMEVHNSTVQDARLGVLLRESVGQHS